MRLLLETARPADQAWQEPFHVVFQAASEATPESELPEDLKERGRIWLGRKATYRLLLSPETAVRVGRSLEEKLADHLERSGRFERLVDPASVSAMLQAGGLEDPLRLSWNELDLPENRKRLARAGLHLGVDLLVVPGLRRYETEIIQRTVPVSDRTVRGADPTSGGEFSYTFRLEAEVAVLDVNSGEWIWRARRAESQKQRTGAIQQDLATALASGKWSPFVRNWLLDTVLEQTPEDRCVSGLASAMFR